MMNKNDKIINEMNDLTSTLAIKVNEYLRDINRLATVKNEIEIKEDTVATLYKLLRKQDDLEDSIEYEKNKIKKLIDALKELSDKLE